MMSSVFYVVVGWHLERKTVESGAGHLIIDARPNTAPAKVLATLGRPYMRVMPTDPAASPARQAYAE
jgi:hypothetical protein